MRNIIEIEELHKTYHNSAVSALYNISLEVEKGSLFGIIGPDGAGKTSLMRILATLLQPDFGTIRIAGLDAISERKSVRQHIGYMPSTFSLYPDLTVKENLLFFSSLFGCKIEENSHLIERIYYHLRPFSNRRAGNLSGGMKQKLALCCTLIHAPSILLLDEPTTGVDPTSRYEFWEILKDLNKLGITVLVSTAYMDEASYCSKLIMMNQGKIIANSAPKDLIDGLNGRLISARSDDMFKLLHDLRDLNCIEECYTFGDVHHLRVANGEFNLQELRELLEKTYQHKNVILAYCPPTIEDCFMKEATKSNIL